MVGRMSSSEAWHIVIMIISGHIMHIAVPHLGGYPGPLRPGVAWRADKQRLVRARSVQVGPSWSAPRFQRFYLYNFYMYFRIEFSGERNYRMDALRLA